MKLDDMISKMSNWTNATGSMSDIVVSSRVRLARNIKGFPFTHRADKKQSSEVISRVIDACKNTSILKNHFIIRMSEISLNDRKFLHERHIISKEFTDNKWEKALIFGEGETISIMVNEEDHLRIQVIMSGFQPAECWETIDIVDTELSEYLDYAFSESWGYLTACSTNTGTGIRISMLIHLPGLVLTKRIGQILKSITQIGLSVRGLYGEDTEVMGNLFQISNQTTLGRSERDLLENIERITRQLIEYEKSARNFLMKEAKIQMEDKIWRAYATLKYSRMISSDEFINLSSAVRLGVSLGILSEPSIKTLNELMILVQPFHLQKYYGYEMQPQERDELRSSLVRYRLENKN